MLRGGVSTYQISRLSVGQASFFNFCFGVNFLNFSEFWPDGSQAKNDKRSPKPEIQPREMSDGMTCVFQENGIGEVCGAPIWKETRDGMVLKICKKYAIWIASLDKPCRMTCCSQTHHGRVAGGCMYVHHSHTMRMWYATHVPCMRLCTQAWYASRESQRPRSRRIGASPAIVTPCIAT